MRRTSYAVKDGAGSDREPFAILHERSPSIMGAPAVLANRVWRTAGSSASRGIPGGDTSIGKENDRVHETRVREDDAGRAAAFAGTRADRFPGRGRADRRPVVQLPHPATGRGHQGDVRHRHRRMRVVLRPRRAPAVVRSRVGRGRRPPERPPRRRSLPRLVEDRPGRGKRSCGTGA